jgi:integrase
MASIRKIPRSQYWIACITLSDGRQTQRTTKCTDRKKAMLIASQLEEAELEARRGLLTEHAVRRHISKTYEIVTGSKLTSYSIEGWLSWWLENKVKAKRKGTSDRYGTSVRSFLDAIGDRRKLDTRHLSHTDAEKFRDKLIESGKSARTVNVDLKTVSSAFNLAKKGRLLDANPFDSLDALPVSEGVKKNFTKEQIEEILRHAEGDWYGLILFGYYTGARISDITQLKRENLDLNGDPPMLRFKEAKKQDKHKRELVIPIHQKLMEWIAMKGFGNSDGYVFPKLQPKGTGGRSGLSQSFKRILLKAGILKELYQKRKEGSVGRTVSPYSFHSLRHSFKTELANKGVPSDLRDVLSGHAKPSVAEGYVHRGHDVLMDAIKVLPDLRVA